MKIEFVSKNEVKNNGGLQGVPTLGEFDLFKLKCET